MHRRGTMLWKRAATISTPPTSTRDRSAVVTSFDSLENLAQPETKKCLPLSYRDDQQTSQESELPSVSDIIIAVMGPTGAGKSTFINKVAGIEETTVGHELESCTQEIQVVRCYDQQGRRVVLVDTPGFDDTNISDLDILHRIADWLKKTYEQGITLSGLLFFHRISDNRMAGSPLKLLETFKNLCGTQALVNVILVTTMWDEVSEDVGEIREHELCQKYWKSMIASGSRTARFGHSYESGWEIVSRVEPQSRRAVLLQREMVDQKKTLPETAAGRSLVRWLVEILETIKKTIEAAKARLPRKTRRTNRQALVDTITKNEVKLKAVNQLLDVYQHHPTRIAVDIPRSSSPDSEVTFLSNPTSLSHSSISLPYSVDYDPCISPPNSPIDEQCGSTASHILHGTITALTIINQLMGLAPIPGVQSVTGLMLTIVEAIEKMESIDESLVTLSRTACSLTSSIIEVAQLGVTPVVEDVIHSFLSDLRDIQVVVRRLASQGSSKRFFLANADRQTIEECNRKLVLICGRVGMQVGVINSTANARLEKKLNHVIQLLEARAQPIYFQYPRTAKTYNMRSATM